MNVRKAFKLLFRDYLGDPEQHCGVIVLVNTSTTSYHVTGALASQLHSKSLISYITDKEREHRDLKCCTDRVKPSNLFTVYSTVYIHSQVSVVNAVLVME